MHVLQEMRSIQFVMLARRACNTHVIPSYVRMCAYGGYVARIQVWHLGLHVSRDVPPLGPFTILRRWGNKSATVAALMSIMQRMPLMQVLLLENDNGNIYYYVSLFIIIVCDLIIISPRRSTPRSTTTRASRTRRTTCSVVLAWVSAFALSLT